MEMFSRLGLCMYPENACKAFILMVILKIPAENNAVILAEQKFEC